MTSEHRVILDTNIFVAAGFRPHSASGRIVEAVRSGALTMVWSDATRAETERIVTRIPPLDATVLEGVFNSGNRFTGELRPDRFVGVPDPEDRKFAALASATGACLITNDEHLLRATGDFVASDPASFIRALPEPPDPG